KRASLTERRAPAPGYTMPRWFCVWENVKWERYPTNWGLPRAVLTEKQCAALGADSCLIEVKWKNPSLGRRFWGARVWAGPAPLPLVGVREMSRLASWVGETAVVAFPVLLGGAI